MGEPRKVMISVVTKSLNVRFSVTTWIFECCNVQDPTAVIHGINVVSSEPTPTGRNTAVKQARDHGFTGRDILVQVDDDMLPAVGWYARMLRFLAEHPGPVAFGSPYCGSFPLRQVNVKSLDGVRYSREQYAKHRNIEQIAAIGTGLFAANMEAFDAVEQAGLLPWFDYEYEDAHHTKVSCTEDFFFCHRLNKAGGKVFCDWESWSGHDKREVIGKPGKELNYAFTRTEPVPLPKPIPTSIRGYMWPQELLWLYEQAQQNGVPGDLLEVGSYCGLSAAALAQAGKLTCVDTFVGDDGAMPANDSLGEFQSNMKMMGLCPIVYPGRSEAVLPTLPPESYRLVLVDGGHELAQVKADLDAAWPLLVPGGLLVVDDYTSPLEVINGVFGAFPAVTTACRQFAGELGLVFSVVPDSKMGYLRKPERTINA